MADRVCDKESFIKKAREIHGDYYNYDKVDYKGATTKVTITCPIHGDFEMTPNNHINAHHPQGCRKCGYKRAADKQRKPQEVFIKEVMALHGDRYDFSDAHYVSNSTPVHVFCKIHQKWFWIRPSDLFNRIGCKDCAKESHREKMGLTKEEFVARSIAKHGDKYDYSKVEYTDNQTKVFIRCKECGTWFWQTPHHHMMGNGCPNCANKHRWDKRRTTKESFIEKATAIHGDKYDYSEVDYVNTHTLVKIRCKKHGYFWQTPHKHTLSKQPHGCPICARERTVSEEENEVYEFIKAHYDGTIIRNDRETLASTKELDMHLPELHLAIEYDGDYWHCLKKNKNPNSHLWKTKECFGKGIFLIHLFGDEWRHKRELAESRLLEVIGKSPRIIKVEDCIIKTIGKTISNKFLEQNYILGSTVSDFGYGLFYNNELVSVMTFIKINNESFEIKRYANKLNTKVVNGEKILFNKFVEDYKPKEMSVRVDWRWDNGVVYEEMGFVFDGMTEPDCSYVKKDRRYPKEKVMTEDVLNEAEETKEDVEGILEKKGIYRIYDCGQACFKWANS